MQILGIAGKKQSGKSTLSNFLHGLQLRSYGVVDNFLISEKGELIVDGISTYEGDKIVSRAAKLDVANPTYEFVLWAKDAMWPFVKNYSFAEALKEIAIELFDCPRNLVYGSDEDKKTVMEHLRWENMPGVVTCKTYENVGAIEIGELFLHEPGPMTIREFLQYFGTDVMRRMYSRVWIDRVMKDIVTEGTNFAIVSDCRFDDEPEAVKKQGGKTIGLTRDPFKDPHKSEQINVHLCDAVIDNENMSIKECCDAALEILKDWGWVSKVESKQRGKATMKINSNREGRNV